MLIKIDKSLVKNIQDDQWPHEVLITLEYLAIARREGKHAVIAEPETVKKILKCSDLSLHSQIVYQKIADKALYISSYTSAVSLYVEVIDNCPEPTFKEIGSISSKKTVIQVSPKFFNDSEMIQKTILLCENFNDGKFYQKIAMVYLQKNKLDIPIKFEYECIGGGGDTIAKEYENIQKLKKRWCLCLVDSDQIAPKASFGQTAQNLKDKLKDKDTQNIVTTTFFILKVRELENLIPRQILSEVSSGDRNREEALKRLNFLAENVEVENVEEHILRFIDLKEGTLLQKIVEDNSDQVKSYWENILDMLPDKSKGFDPWCQDNWQCGQQKKKRGQQKKKRGQQKEKCQCYISNSFGDNIMKNTIEWLENERKSSQEIAKMIEPYLESDWDELGELIFSWCIAELPFLF